VPHIVALGAAAVLAREELATAQVRLRYLRDHLHDSLRAQIPGLRLNGHPELRLPNTLNLSFPGVNGADLLTAVPEIAASIGSACHAGDHAVSGVLAAIGCDLARARSAVRLSVGRFSCAEEISHAGQVLVSAWQGLSK
jgi:cysteine desulfurase